jgi:hypothetical protein
MKRSTQWLGTASALALAFAPTIAAAAPVGTAANSSISNSVTVSYNVGGVAQTPITSAADVFTVDRKIDLVVTTQDSSAVVVTPGQTNAVTRFTVTNNSNGTIDFLLAATQQSGGTAKFSGNDTTDVSNVRVYVETNGTAGWQAGDTLASSLAAVASGDAVTVYVVSDVAVGAAQAAQATMILTATAASGASAVGGTPAGTAGTGGSAITQTATGTANGKLTMETVFADAQAEAQTSDGLRDGKHAARSDYRVDTAQLSVAKYSRVVSDPHSGSASPRAIPGAVVEYCIVVQNTSSTVSATSVSVSDTVDAATLMSVTVPTIGGTFNGTDTCTGGSGGSWTSTAGGIYQYSIGNVAASATSLVRFQATIR